MTVLFNTPITTAVASAATFPVHFWDGTPKNVSLQAIFVYGSGGTSADAYVQTSLDGGVTWIDVANFHFATTTTSALYNLSVFTPKTAAVVPKDGALSINSCLNGILGSLFRVRYASTGTYSGTTLRVDIAAGAKYPALQLDVPAIDPGSASTTLGALDFSDEDNSALLEATPL